MSKSAIEWTLVAMLGISSTFANAQTRGELLYSTHCVTCHTTQVHWRGNKQAYDWDSLKFQVIPFPDRYDIRHEAADSATARQGEATTCRIDLEMELDAGKA